VKRRVAREMTVEEYDAWAKATDKFEEIAQAADEVGGPRLSLVPLPEQNEAWPTDLLPPAEPDPDAPPVEATPFDGIPLEDSRKRLAGWCVERQRLFLTVLAERDWPGPPRRRRGAALGPLGAGAAPSVSRVRQGLARRRAARGPPAGVHGLRPRDQRPGRADL
jgi:hypothetical protein